MKPAVLMKEKSSKEVALIGEWFYFSRKIYPWYRPNTNWSIGFVNLLRFEISRVLSDADVLRGSNFNDPKRVYEGHGIRPLGHID